tara:strand:- start:981 stop:1205 length:225 start_codon:yes stop_codon:yes gene_type:complete
MIPEQVLINLLIVAGFSYLSLGVIVWYVESSLKKIAVEVIESSKHVKNQRELLTKCKKRKNPLRYILWPIEIFK